MNDGKRDKTPVRSLRLYLFVFTATLYVFSASPNYYNNDSAVLRAAVVQSLVERNDVSVSSEFGMIGRDGRAYSWLGIGSVLLSVPFYLFGKAAGIPAKNILMFINPLFGAATVVLIFLTCILLGYREKISLLVALLYGITTIAWPYAKHPFDHVMETFFILLSFHAMYRYGIEGWRAMLVLAIMAAGIAFLVRPTSIFVIPALSALLFAMYSRKHDVPETRKRLINDMAWISIGFLPFISLFFLYNWYCFGSAFTTGYSLIGQRAGIHLLTGTSLITGMAGYLVSPGKGYFYYSPVAALAIFRLKSFVKRHPCYSTFALFFIASYLLFLSKNLYWHGDWAWGPRYIFAITPFVIMPIAELFSSSSWKKSPAVKACVTILIVSGFLIQLAGVSVDFQKYFIHMKIKEKIDFVIVRHNEIQPIVELPPEVYFQWNRSPIYFQFLFCYNFLKGSKEDNYSLYPGGSSIPKGYINQINEFDYHWARKYGEGNRNLVLPFVLSCVFLMLYCGIRLYKWAYVAPNYQLER